MRERKREEIIKEFGLRVFGDFFFFAGTIRAKIDGYGMES